LRSSRGEGRLARRHAISHSIAVAEAFNASKALALKAVDIQQVGPNGPVTKALSSFFETPNASGATIDSFAPRDACDKDGAFGSISSLQWTMLNVPWRVFFRSVGRVGAFSVDHSDNKSCLGAFQASRPFGYTRREQRISKESVHVCLAKESMCTTFRWVICCYATFARGLTVSTPVRHFLRPFWG
jgi:hypothetical protein